MNNINLLQNQENFFTIPLSKKQTARCSLGLLLILLLLHLYMTKQYALLVKKNYLEKNKIEQQKIANQALSFQNKNITTDLSKHKTQQNLVAILTTLPMTLPDDTAFTNITFKNQALHVDSKIYGYSNAEKIRSCFPHQKIEVNFEKKIKRAEIIIPLTE